MISWLSSPAQAQARFPPTASCRDLSSTCRGDCGFFGDGRGDVSGLVWGAASPGARRSGRILVTASITLIGFGLIMVGPWSKPGQTRHFRGFPWLERPFIVVVWVILAFVTLWAQSHIIRGRGLLAIVYGFTWRGRPYVGTLAGVVGVPWRRIRCDAGVWVRYEPPRQTENWQAQYHRLVVTSGSRKAVFWSIAPPAPDTSESLAKWFGKHNIERARVQLPS